MRGDIKIEQEYMPEANRRVWELHQYDGVTWHRLAIRQPSESGLRIIDPFATAAAAGAAIAKLESGDYVATTYIAPGREYA